MKLSTEEFIKKAQIVHKNKYDYSKVEYISSCLKVEIICPIHGSFFETATEHLGGHGCRQCGIVKRTKDITLLKEEFIERAQKVHNKKYDYSKVKYVNSKTKIEIICPDHGCFLQKPVIHMKGSGCQKCGIEKSGLSKLSNNKKFIIEAQKIHGTAYNYSKIKYIGSKTKIEIICYFHGPFFQKPNSHLSGQGCPECGTEKIKRALRGSTSEFIERAKKIHKNKYDYSEVLYVKNRQKIKIKCPIHGVFYQIAGHHLNGSGCVKCRNEKLRDLFKSNTEEFIKRAKKIYGDKYNYSDTNYLSAHKKIKIRCPIHGYFFQSPHNHLSGMECKLCGLLKQWKVTITHHWKTGEELACIGSYEIKTVEYLNKNKIDFLWQPKKFKLPENLSSVGKTYLPDAYLIEENKWIEIKGYFWGNSKKKWEWFHSEHNNSELWNRKRLKEIGIL